MRIANCFVPALALCAVSLAAMPSPEDGPVMIPNGTAFRIRTIDAIDVDVAQAGMKFRASLDDPIMITARSSLRGAPTSFSWRRRSSKAGR